MGRRSRRRAAESAGGSDARTEATSPRVSRSEARDAAARERLEPLAEGERPRAVTVGAIVAVVFGAVNAGLWLAGLDIRGQRPSVLALVFSVLLLVTAWGMWRARYWAVLGFQVLLALTLISVGLPVVLSANALQAAVFAVVVIIPGGALFWFLVKAMARIQMPQRR
ncbi:MAG TPA: hypothetical protein VK387_08905 [Thermoleophilaceae bacterium]|nr:hypothetical protein [Thermoleophilaceae bacterium]